jgi:hypothetical protein
MLPEVDLVRRDYAGHGPITPTVKAFHRKKFKSSLDTIIIWEEFLGIRKSPDVSATRIAPATMISGAENSLFAT